MLHVLIHMDRHVERATSEQISRMIATNPVVVRRMMAGMRDRGVVMSEKGHGGGWQLTRSLDKISLRDVYEGVGAPPLFNIGPEAELSFCLVEQAVDRRLDTTLKDAETRLLAQFDTITVEDVAEDFEQQLKTTERGTSCSAGSGPT
ncbi:RrF2 family transcriptional regulator [Falsirhodobacter sp. 20TX0035]|uniref:RrF2 family transcriptional regulator n=1 Tax=Falsirhodobacter sp. 20TX0035 TaxID=3022019 RepID=UPI00232D27DF|nr:Rrf2 family transcriptional regulator [Falsirhodobacter sp. 20TX0035]MDB6454250.1 Rrf2 family transcriptional regulator [Falsirhodobacter sp. 20TX0035]